MKYIKLFEQLLAPDRQIQLDLSLFNAVRYLHLRDIKTLLNAGANVNIQNSRGRTPLINAVCVSNGSESKISKVIELLVKYGADINTQDTNGKTALIKSAEYPRYNVMIKLIEMNAEWYIQDEDDCDFLDNLNTSSLKRSGKSHADDLKKQYPNKYKEYLMKKDANMYNL
jgi:ankyrin repeat protein